MKKVIFACVHSAGRSQMSAAFFNDLRGERLVVGIAAGTQPAERIHPEVVEVMGELGIDLAQAKPQKLTAELVADAALLIRLGCGENCPFVPGLKVLDWPLEDPKGKSRESVREIRDEVRKKVLELLATLP